jgi:hypothetical protein
MKGLGFRTEERIHDSSAKYMNVVELIVHGKCLCGNYVSQRKSDGQNNFSQPL